MKNNTDKINCFSFSRRDIVILLMIFNTTYYFFVSLLRQDFMGCLITAVAAGLIVLLIFTLRDVFSRLNGEIDKLKEENTLLRKSFRDEYQRVHRLKRKYELVLKANNENADAKETVISYTDDPVLYVQKVDSVVHINYLNRFNNEESQHDLKGNNPTG